MNDVFLDGRAFHSKEALHASLQTALSLPEHYGKNLDALFDCLTEPTRQLHLHLIHRDSIVAQLGNYGEAFLQVLDAAVVENHQLQLTIDENDSNQL